MSGRGISKQKNQNLFAMPKKKTKKGTPEVHDDLKGFNIKVNEFGEIITNLEIDKLNSFLDEKVVDKKLNDTDESAKKDKNQQENTEKE